MANAGNQVLYLGVNFLFAPIFLMAIICADRSWYMELKDPVTNKKTTLVNVDSDSKTAFFITNGAHLGYQSQVDYFDLMITANEYDNNDSVFLEWTSPGIHPGTGEYVPDISVRYLIKVPINQGFRFYRHMTDCSFYSGAITGSWIRFYLEYQTGERTFRINLIDVSGGHSVKPGKPPVTFTVNENGYRTRRGSRNE